MSTDVSGNSFYSTMLNAVKSGGARDETSGYRDNFDNDLSIILTEHLGIEADQAQSFIDIAQASAGGDDASVEDVLNEILELLDLDDDSSIEDAEDTYVDDLDFSVFIGEAFAEIASGEGVFTEDHAEELADILGVDQEDAKDLIEHTGGNFDQIIKFLFDDDRDGEISFDELVSDNSALRENLESSKEVMNDFESFTHDGKSFEFGADGSIPEDSIANSSLEEGKEGMAAFLTESLGFFDGEAEDVIDDLFDEGLLTPGEDGKLGALALIQFKAIIAEYSMRKDDLDDGDDKAGLLMASAKDAKEALEGITGGDWDDPDGSREMIDQINQYYRQQMNLLIRCMLPLKAQQKWHPILHLLCQIFLLVVKVAVVKPYSLPFIKVFLRLSRHSF